MAAGKDGGKEGQTETDKAETEAERDGYELYKKVTERLDYYSDVFKRDFPSVHLIEICDKILTQLARKVPERLVPRDEGETDYLYTKARESVVLGILLGDLPPAITPEERLLDRHSGSDQDILEQAYRIHGIDRVTAQQWVQRDLSELYEIIPKEAAKIKMDTNMKNWLQREEGKKAKKAAKDPGDIQIC